MEKKVREVIRSEELDFDFLEIFNYEFETFGQEFATIFLENVKHEILGLSFQYYLHPECRQLQTKTQIYRNIILGRYLIIYRVKAHKIEVLRALHRSQNPNVIKAIKKLKLNKHS